MLSPAQMLERVSIGNDAGWALTFHRENERSRVVDRPVLTIGRDDYDASIEAALPEGFGPGKYTFRIEGLTDKHYAAIRLGDGQPTVVRLHLYWRDANASAVGYLANLAEVAGDGPSRQALATVRVAELTVTKVSRTVGARRYECVVEARERAFMKLRSRRVEGTLKAQSTLAMVRRLTLEAGVESVPAIGTEAASYGFGRDGTLPPLTPQDGPVKDPRQVEPQRTYASAMVELGEVIEEAMTGARGRGVLLIRNGKLIVGKRPIPPLGTPPHDLTHATGFIDSEAIRREEEPTVDDEPSPASSRDQFKLTLKGRPDIRPGDVVRFSPAVEDGPTQRGSGFGAAVAAFRGPLVGDAPAGPPVTLYVNSVEHRLSRDSGFATALVGVVIKDGERFTDAWDKATDGGSHSAPDSTGNSGGTASAAVGAARAISAVARDKAAGVRMPEVAEVRAATTTGVEPNEPPAQTLTVWRGLGPPDGRANQARRLEIRRVNPAPLEGVAYATPFAWGPCGLVLPRYPGTRTLLVHRNGHQQDPVDVGALWQSGRGPESQPGDWWLILPVGVTPSARASTPDSAAPPPEHTGPVSNDLIDADGRRTIEVGELTIRVGREALGQAGTRPARPAQPDTITIEHTKKGAKITITPDGTISIQAAKDLELNAPDGEIRMQAKAVKVRVDTAMEVS